MSTSLRSAPLLTIPTSASLRQRRNVRTRATLTPASRPSCESGADINDGRLASRLALSSRRELLSASSTALATAPLVSLLATWPQATIAASSGLQSVTLPGATKPFPLASFGLQVYDDETARKLTLLALQVGYRNFFASVLAGNQRGFAAAIKQSGVPREELYICGSVLSNRARGYDAAFRLSRAGCKDNTTAMRSGGIEYLDAIMLDYPGPDADSIRGQWAALEEMKADGLVNDLAVSNFSSKQLDVVLAVPDASPITVNQLPLSLANPLPGYIEANQERGVLVQSWSPLSRLSRGQLAVCREVGAAHGGKSAHQVALRWIVQRGAGFAVQSKSAAHFAEDLDVFGWELSPEEMARLSKVA